MRLSLFALVLSTTAAAAQTDVTSVSSNGFTAAEPIAPPTTWIWNADFPPDVMRQSGLVGTRLSINPEGKVYRCHVMATSGVPKLDKKTCLIFLARARFTPARDENQHATFGSYNYFVNWTNPEQIENPKPIVTAEIVFWVDRLPSGEFSRFSLKYKADSSGKIYGCGAIKPEAEKALVKAACDELNKTGVEPLTDLTGQKISSIMTSQVLFTIDKKLPENIPGGTYVVESLTEN